MTRRWTFGLCVLALSALRASPQGTLRLPAAGQEATFDGKSFLLGGKRVLLRSAGVHYFRIPPEEWRDRLLQTRLAGFNMVETPVPWNLHQPARDTFRFEGVADLAQFLDLCRESKLLAFVRVGPYVNAAVTNGGLPTWLGDDPRLLVRSLDLRFIEAVRTWWGKLLPMVVARQAPRGAVALVQIENGYEGPQPAYLSKLYEEAQALGLSVPVAASTVRPCRGFDRFPASNDGLFLTTELMPVGPLPWGEARRLFPCFDTLVLEGLARGLDGYNHPMWAAGTNFALLPASSFPTRHEAGTCGLLEGGGLTPIFNEMKKVNLFGQAFEAVLTQATGLKSHPLLDQARRAGLVAYGRSDGQTRLLFLKHRAAPNAVPLTDPATGQSVRLSVDDTTFRHIVLDYPLTEKTSLAFSTAQVLSLRRLPDRQVFVIYAPSGAETVMVFRTPKAPTLRAGESAFAWDEGRKQLVLKWSCATKNARGDFAFEADTRVHVIALEEGLTARTYVLDGLGVLVGAPGVGPHEVPGTSSGTASASVELRFPSYGRRYPLSFYPDAKLRSVREGKGITGKGAFDEKAGRMDLQIDLDVATPTPILLRRWEVADLGPEPTAGFDDSPWPESPKPQPLGQAAYGWYRCRFQAPRPGPRKLVFENVADAITVYLNGRLAGRSATKPLMDTPRAYIHPVSLDITVAAGENVLAVLAKNWGQYRNTASYGVPLARTTAWGIVGNVLLDGKALSRWRQHEGLSPEGRQFSWEALPASGKPAKELEAVRWYRVTFKQPKDPGRLVARVLLKGLGYGTLWINGRPAGLYQQRQYDGGHGYYLPRAWLRDTNELLLLEEDGRAPEEADVLFDRDASIIPLRLELE